MLTRVKALMPWHECGGQDSLQKLGYLLPLWVLGVELRSSGLLARALSS